MAFLTDRAPPTTLDWSGSGRRIPYSCLDPTSILRNKRIKPSDVTQVVSVWAPKLVLDWSPMVFACSNIAPQTRGAWLRSSATSSPKNVVRSKASVKAMPTISSASIMKVFEGPTEISSLWESSKLWHKALAQLWYHHRESGKNTPRYGFPSQHQPISTPPSPHRSCHDPTLGAGLDLQGLRLPQHRLRAAAERSGSLAHSRGR